MTELATIRTGIAENKDKIFRLRAEIFLLTVSSNLALGTLYSLYPGVSRPGREASFLPLSRPELF